MLRLGLIDKRIDVALFGHGIRVAFEVSVTNRESYELPNIKKALEADFNFVWMIASDPSHLKKLEQYARKHLTVEEETHVLFGNMEDARQWLGRFEQSDQPSSQITGYDIETILIPPENVSDHQYRRDQLQRSLVENK